MEVLISGQIKMRDKASGEFVYQVKSSPSCREGKLDTAMEIGMESSDIHLIIHDITDFEYEPRGSV